MDNEIKLEWGEPLTKEIAEIEKNANAPVKEVESSLTLTALKPEEQKAVMQLVSRIDITDSNAVGMYGADSQNKIAAFSDSILKNVKTKDAGEAGKLLSSLVVEIKNFDTSSNEKQGFLGIFTGVKKQFDRITAQYSKIETNVDHIVSNLESHKRQLLKDVAMLDEMYANNYNYFRELSMYIVAGKEKIAQINNEVIPELRKKAEQTKDEADVQKLNDMINNVSRFEKKIHDLTLSRMISIQMAPQIRLIQNNDSVLIDKIQSSIVNSIPLWKNQIVIALGLANSKAALESQRQVSEMTNELLRKNSELLKQGSLEIAEESEKSIVSVETIQKTNQDLIETINGVIDIQKKGREARIEAERELIRMENEFKQALLSTSGRQQ